MHLVALFAQTMLYHGGSHNGHRTRDITAALALTNTKALEAIFKGIISDLKLYIQSFDLILSNLLNLCGMYTQGLRRQQIEF